MEHIKHLRFVLEQYKLTRSREAQVLVKLDQNQQHPRKSLSPLGPNIVSLSGRRLPHRHGLGMFEHRFHSLRHPAGHAHVDHARTILYRRLHFTILLPTFTIANRSLQFQSQVKMLTTVGNDVWN